MQSNIYTQKHNVDANLLLARDICVKNIERHVKTVPGVSVVTYKQEKEEPRVGGEIQGKADVPALYTLGISILIHSYKAIASGSCIQNCTRSRAIEHNNVAFSDNTDGHVSAEHNCKFPTEMVLGDIRQNVRVWNNLVMISCGSLALHKKS